MVQWRNWYTRRTQNAVPERGCGFESHLDYKKQPEGKRVEKIIQIIGVGIIEGAQLNFNRCR